MWTSHSNSSQTCEDKKFYHDMQEVLTKQPLCQFKKTETYFLDRYLRFLHFNFDDLVESVILGHVKLRPSRLEDQKDFSCEELGSMCLPW